MVAENCQGVGIPSVWLDLPGMAISAGPKWGIGGNQLVPRRTGLGPGTLGAKTNSDLCGCGARQHGARYTGAAVWLDSILFCGPSSPRFAAMRLLFYRSR